MKLTAGLTWLMAIAVGLIVANLYYIQPLMGDIARQFGVADSTIGYAVTICQAGLAFGTLTILPLGDVTDRRRLIIMSCVGSGISLLLMATAQSVPVFLGANLLLGITSIATHLQVSYAAHLAPPDKRGHAVGAVMSGLLVGVLAARTVSGYAGAWFGWRTMITAAAVVTFLLGILLRIYLPKDNESHTMRYSDLLGSLPRLFASQSVLRDACVYGALTFAVFNAFWATFTFYIESPVFSLGSKAVGEFSLVAVGGALTANLAGRLTSRVHPWNIVAGSLLLTLLAFVVYYYFGATIAGLVVGIVLMDLGIQATHIGNQTMVHSLMPQARNRLHCIYMVTYFIGGSAGSALGNYSYARLGWTGTCLTGAALSALALIYWVMRKVSRYKDAKLAA